MNSKNALEMALVTITTTDHSDMAAPTTSLRGMRSASELSGMEPSRNKMPKAPPMAPMVPSDTSSDFWMSGAITANADVSSVSTKPSRPMSPISPFPPRRRPWRKVSCSASKLPSGLR